ncbi:putative cystathionine gamma-lyase 2 [Melanaphis sacchari]|uniref:cystathionine gamma-lyase n=1 Tax=Melanaphis sacchari TaxID=742174 RepID=A0A2H8TLA8_9HEMI|nr:putative cystathionine gamma-lyase 2 [Melanaphis sacchari]
MCDDGSATKNNRKDPNFGTKLVHAGHNPSEWTYKDVVPPIAMSTIFNSPSPGVIESYEYSRCGNPTRSVLEKCLIALDHAKYALAYSSGMAAISSIVNLLAPGDHVLCSSDVYGGTHRLLNKVANPAGILFDFVDFSDTATIITNIRPNTKLVWFESLSNPLMNVLDVQKVSEAVHNTRADIIVAVDNSFVTPYFQRPLELGVDVIMYSLSKYMNGHSDIVMGALVTNNKDLYDKLYVYQYTCGNIPSSFDCYMVNRGLKTLHVRMEQHMKNATAVALYLESHPKVLKVNYMGLPSHQQHEIIKKQFTGHNGIVSFYINGGIKVSTKLLESLKLFCITCSLGCYESLAALPCKMTHTSLTDEERQSTGIHDNLIRLSIGLEYYQDLIDDLEQAIIKSGAVDKS